MKIPRSLLLLVVLLWSASAQDGKDPEFRAAMKENILARIEESDTVATICIYEQEWIPPSSEEPKGEVVHRAVITSVHKGDLAVGTQLEFSYLIEDPPKLFSPFRGTVPGKLEYLFFSHEGLRKIDDRLILALGTHWSCDRLNGIHAELLQESLAGNPNRESTREADTTEPGTQPGTKP